MKDHLSSFRNPSGRVWLAKAMSRGDLPELTLHVLDKNLSRTHVANMSETFFSDGDL